MTSMKKIAQGEAGDFAGYKPLIMPSLIGAAIPFIAQLIESLTGIQNTITASVLVLIAALPAALTAWYDSSDPHVPMKFCQFALALMVSFYSTFMLTRGTSVTLADMQTQSHTVSEAGFKVAFKGKPRFEIDYRWNEAADYYEVRVREAGEAKWLEAIPPKRKSIRL